jgi:hypothetical protein
MQLILHAADISNPGKPWIAHKKCVDEIMQEFFEQGDLEKKRRLPISPLCDRSNTDVPRTQLIFNEVIVEPCLTCLGDLFDLLRKDCEDATLNSAMNRRKGRLSRSSSKPRKSTPNAQVTVIRVVGNLYLSRFVWKWHRSHTAYNPTTKKLNLSIRQV